MTTQKRHWDDWYAFTSAEDMLDHLVTQVGPEWEVEQLVEAFKREIQARGSYVYGVDYQQIIRGLLDEADFIGQSRLDTTTFVGRRV